MKFSKNTNAAIITAVAIIMVVIIGYLVVLKGRYYKLSEGLVYDKWTNKICMPKR